MSYLNRPCILKSAVSPRTGLFDFILHCPEIAEKASAGQFLQVKVPGFFLRRPISICEIFHEKGDLRMVFEVRGKGTASLSEFTPGMPIEILGPLGNGFSLLEKDKRALILGGGVGVPPLLPLAQYYGKNSSTVLGFQCEGVVMLKEDFLRTGSELILCTDDGSEGVAGNACTPLSALLEKQKPDIVYACGPRPMLKAVSELADRYGIPCEVSMEERMGCGVGACLVCACKTKQGSQESFSHVCKDGPVFNAKEIVW